MHGRTALMLAASRGHAPVVKTLLGASAAINAVDPSGESALRLAVAGSHLGVVEELLRQNARVDGRGGAGAGGGSSSGGGWDSLLALNDDARIRAVLLAEQVCPLVVLLIGRTYIMKLAGVPTHSAPDWQNLHNETSRCAHS